ncbi:MAG: sugar phosphate isomerase/epimerase family protein [Bacteroidales bacterium]
MRLLASSMLMFDYPISEVISYAHALGYDGVEIWHFHLLKTGEKPADIARLARQHNLHLSVHALSWDLNITSHLEKLREVSLSLIESSIHLTRNLGSEIVVVHPGRITVPQENSEESWELLIGGIYRLVQVAQDAQVKLSLEIMEHVPREFFVHPSDATRLIKAIDNPFLSITVDLAHVPWECDVLEYLINVPCVEHIHISDATSKKIHLPLGQGERDYRDALKYIQHNLPNSFVVIEGMESYQRCELIEHNKKQMDILLASTMR